MIALAFVGGLLWLWLGSDARRREHAAAPAGEPALAPRSEAPELLPATPLPSGQPVAGEERGELEPFASAAASRTAEAGAAEARKLGSLRGHLTVAGEQPFPREWRLVARPSTILPKRERAAHRSLEITDGSADFELRELPLGGYDVFAEAEGFNAQILPVQIEAGSEHPFVNIRIVPCGTLEGRILDAQGLAAEGIAVTLFGVEGDVARETSTDAGGVYRFEVLPDGAYELMIGKATAPLVRDRHAVRFLAPHLTFPDLTLPLLGEIHLRVVDSYALPLEGVEVRGSGTNGGIVEGKTDFDGRLVAKHLPAGHFRIRLQHPAFEAKHARRIAVDVEPGKVAEAPVRLGP